jgi:hypothetical protein
MDMTIGSRLKKAVNVFLNRDPTEYRTNVITYSNGGYRPDRRRLTRGKDRTIVNTIFNRIALDVASVNITHCKTVDGRFKSEIDSGLNECLNINANMDQTGRAFIQDVVVSMFDEGCVAIVPVDTDINPKNTTTFDILSMRTGKIVEWYPDNVKVNVYNQKTMKRENVIISKSKIAIIENPFYSVMNEPNSTLSRLLNKLALLDMVDDQTCSGKLDLIIQLPYSVKSATRRSQANDRVADIEEQLKNSKYGVAYIDGTEKVTQLNRPLENNLMKQVEYWTSMLFSQLSITQAILDGTADEATMTNYYARTIEPIVASITDEIKRKFLSKTARTQGQSIEYFIDPFRLIPPKDLAEIADKFTRNEIMTSNEFRQIIGRKPSDDPKADQLINSNLNHPEEQSNTLPDNQNEPATNQENEQPSGEMTPEEAQTIFESLDETQQQAMYVIIGEILNDEEA